jgi:membrane protease YdiL (CAAX protease family)
MRLPLCPWQTENENAARYGCVSRARRGTRTPTVLTTSTSSWRVYQFRHPRRSDCQEGLFRWFRVARQAPAFRTVDHAYSGGVSYSPSDPSPAPPLSRASLVIGLYGAMALGALVIAAGRGNPDLYRLEVDADATMLLGGPVIGFGLGLAVVGATRLATRHLQWARDLHASFHDLLGPLTGKEMLILALASSIGEELLFRGALLPWFGVWIQGVIFALLHVGPGRRFLPWTISALVLGFAFGWLAVWTKNLGGPIAAHFAINFFNLRYIVRTRRP